MTTKRRISRAEQAKELQLMHAAGDDACWGRPDTETVNAVWRLVAPTLPAPLQALAPTFTARQVLTVALARCVQVGEEPWGKTKKTRRRRHTFSQNHLFDAVAPKWSRTFKTIAEVGHPGLVPTPNVVHQRRASAEEARRQLLAVGVRLIDIWKIIAGDWSKSDRSKRPGTNPLFYLTRPNAKLGYRVHFRDTEALAEFRRLLPTTPDRSARLLLATDPWPVRVDRYQVCAERPYNGVEEDETVLQVLDALERTRLCFHVRRFKADCDRWEGIVEQVGQWKTRVPYTRRAPFARRVKIARKLQTKLAAYGQVRGQVDALPDAVLIRSRFFRDQEGRFHARHFWPPHVSPKFDQTQRLTRSERGTFGHFKDSERDRWFSDRYGRALGGYDVASSQTQLLAVLLGLTDLEALTRNRYFKMKRYLADEAMARLPLRYAPKSAAALVPVMKDLWIRVLYGGKLKEIVWDHFDVLVPGTFTKDDYIQAVREDKRHPTTQSAERKRLYNNAIKEAEHNLTVFLEAIPWYGKPGEGKLSDFFRASDQIAKSARQRDIYAGVTFIDPFAGTTIRWNPPRQGRDRMNCSGFQVALRLPGGWSGKRGTPGRRYIDAVPHHETGDYPVSAQKLKQAVGPGVIHLLDAFFNALVIRGLERAGIVDFVALHDCWSVPIIPPPDPDDMPPHQQALRDVIEEAGRVWLEGLGGVYARLVDYLTDTEFEPWVHRLQAQWEQRVREKKWPDFSVDQAFGVAASSGPYFEAMKALEAVKATLGANVSQDREEDSPF
jgi:hypothetical protein